MAQAPSVTLDPIKYLQTLTEFNGDRNDLYNFIILVERIHPILTQYDEMSQLIFSDIIKSRLQGKAREIIEINFHVKTWTDIKNVLINNFGEKLGLEELYDNMRSVTFKTNTSDFYNEIKDKLRRLNNKTSLIMGENPGTEAIAKNNMRSALNIFREKIPEPMKTILACRNPDSLEKAMEILFKSGYANYGNKIFKVPNHPRNKDYSNSNYRYVQTNPNSQYQNNFSQNRFRSYSNPQNRTSSSQNDYQNSQQRPNTYPQYRPNYSFNQQRNFSNRPNSDTNFQRRDCPEPMDVNTAQTCENFHFPASQDNYHM